MPRGSSRRRPRPSGGSAPASSRAGTAKAIRSATPPDTTPASTTGKENQLPNAEQVANGEVLAESGQHPPRLYFDMGALLSGGLPPAPQPTIGRRDDGRCIFYDGQVNLVFGDPETGKTWLSLWCAASKLTNDDTSRVAIIDMDHNGPAATAARLLAFGVPAEVLADTNRFRYVEPEDRSHVSAIVADLTDWRPDVVIVDSLGELMPLYGANSYSGDDFTAVNAVVLKPLAKAGAAVLVIDHLSKGADSRNFGPVGTAAKRRAIGGVSLRVIAKDAFTPGTGGAAYLKVNKDRHGGLREHCPTGDREPLAGTFTMRVFHDALTGEIKAPDGTETVADNHALGAVMTRDVTADVDRLNALQPPPESVRDVSQRMAWGTSRASDALKAWRSLTGHTAPKNQHETGTPATGQNAEVPLLGNGKPYTPSNGSNGTANRAETAAELALHPVSAVTGSPVTDAKIFTLNPRTPPLRQPRSQTAAKWLAAHLTTLQRDGHTTAQSFAVYNDGMAAGHKYEDLRQAARSNRDIQVVKRLGSKGAIWSITPQADTTPPQQTNHNRQEIT